MTMEPLVGEDNGGVFEVSHWTKFGAFNVGTVFNGMGTVLTGRRVGMHGL